MNVTSSAAKAFAPIDPQVRRAIGMLIGHLPDNLQARDIILFGSRARQTHHADSDADVAIVIPNLRDRYALVFDLAGVAFDIMLETGILVQAVPLRTEEFDFPEQANNPAFIRAIHRDGIRL